KELLAIHGAEGTAYLRRRFFRDLRQYNIPERAAQIAPRPFLIIHGTADEVVPFTHAQELYRAAQAPKTLTPIRNADHRFSAHINQVWDTFFSWLHSSQG